MARIALFALLVLAAGSAEAVKLRLDPYSTQCINEEAAAAGDVVSGSFVGTVRGGKKGDLFVHRTFFDLEITAESGEMLHQVRNRQDAKFEFIMPTAGRFKACLRNYGRHKTEVHYHSYIGHKTVHDKLTSDQLFPLVSSAKTIGTVLRQLQQEQTYLSTRDAVHLATNESTARRAVAYAFLEAAGLVAVSVVQVMLVKRLFEGKQARSSSSSAARFGTPTWGV